MKKNFDTNGRWLLWLYARKRRIELIAALLLVVVQVSLGILLARQLGKIVDVGLMADKASFTQVFYLLALLWLSSDLAIFVRQVLARRIAEIVTHNLREKVSLHISHVSIPSLELKHSGDYISRLSNDIQAIRYMVASEIPSLIQGLLGFVAALVVLGTVSWKVTLLTVSVAPVMVVIASILGKAMGTSLKEWQGDMAVINALAQDATSGIVVTKAYNLQNHLERRFYLAGERAVNRAVKLAFVKGQLNSAMLVLSVMPFLILFGVGGFEVISGKLSLGQLLMMLNLLNNLTWPLQGMAQNFANIKAALQAADRIFEILTFPTERTGGITRFAYEDVEYAVEFDQVSFTYQTQEAVL